MSVTKRQGSRNSFGSTLPVLLPLYDNASESWQFVADAEIACGTGDDCQFRLAPSPFRSMRLLALLLLPVILPLLLPR